MDAKAEIRQSLNKMKNFDDVQSQEGVELNDREVMELRKSRKQLEDDPNFTKTHQDLLRKSKEKPLEINRQSKENHMIIRETFDNDEVNMPKEPISPNAKEAKHL